MGEEEKPLINTRPAREGRERPRYKAERVTLGSESYVRLTRVEKEDAPPKDRGR